MKARRIGWSASPVTFACEAALAGLAAARSLASAFRRPALPVGDAHPPDAHMPAAWPHVLALALIGSALFGESIGRFRRTLGSMA